MYTLHKMSKPVWSKTYNTIEELTTAVHQCMCALCIYGFGSEVGDMLASDCGVDYTVDGLPKELYWPHEKETPAPHSMRW